MARRKGKVLLWLLLIAFIGICAFIGYTHFKNKKDEQGNKDGITTDTWLTVIETSVAYRQESTTVDMLKGVIKTNEQVEKIFVNINGMGVQYLDFTPSLIQTTTSTYIAHNITPIDALCSVGVLETQTVTVDLYVEYDGRSFKVDTQAVTVISSAFKVISANIQYAENAMAVRLSSGTIQANAKVDKIIVNVQGLGSEEVSFTESAPTSEQAYYEYTLSPITNICNTGYFDDTTKTVDIYVESNGRNYKVDTQEVFVRSCWTPNY